MSRVQMVIAVAFWLCAGGVVYAYLLYPIILFVLARMFGKGGQAAVVDDSALSTLSILIAAHDEEAVIGERVRNALATDYPPEKLQVIVASDGSTDRTAEIVRGCTDGRVELLDFPIRRGKASVVNAAMKVATGRIVLLTDANTHLDPAASRMMVRWFADPSIGIVCGRLILVDPLSGKNVDGLYWKYETVLKKHESRLGALLGSNGAIYSIRRDAYCPIPDGTIVDDFVIPLLAKLRYGWKIVYDWEAVAREESAPDVATEFRRRSRIGAGGWQAIGLLWRLMNPRRGWVAFTFFSHKVLRWLCPFFLIGALVANSALWRSPFYAVLMALQLAFYAAALIGGHVGKGVPLSPVFRLANMFVGMNAALFVGFFRWLSGSQGGAWSRTQRTCETDLSVNGQSGAVAAEQVR
jgi:cellulose synthase/poly-beta-1,6-N-acetylglucosamine synthase-like glycosyltransferase